MKRHRFLMLASVLGFSAAVGSTALHAQARRGFGQRDTRLEFETQVGLAFPGRQLARFVGVGPSVTGELGYPLNRHFALAVYGNYNRFSGDELLAGTVQGPDLAVFNYGVIVEGRTRLPQSDAWTVEGQIGVGASLFNSDDFTAPLAIAGTDFKHTYPAAQIGFNLGYDFSQQVTGYIGSQLHWMFVQRSDTQPWRALDPATIPLFSKAWTMPVSAGFRVMM